METVNCNFCGSSSYITKYQPADWLLNRPDVVTKLVQCQQCGLIYQNPRPSISEMDQHYPQDYEPYHSYKEKKQSWLMRKASTYGLNNRARLITTHKPNGSLLDIGCATGDFLQHMKNAYGWSVQGVEVSEYASDYARNEYGIDVFTGTLEQACFQDNSFDAVTMWDVLEHLHDPSGTLKEINRILKPGGILALRVPNAASLDAKIFGAYWSGLDSPRHLYVFNQTTLSKLLTKNDLYVINATSKYGSYLGFALSCRMWMVGKRMRPFVRELISNFMYSPFARLASAPIFFVYSLTQKAAQLSIVARAQK